LFISQTKRTLFQLQKKIKKEDSLGTQASAEATPVLTLTMQNAVTVTVVFAANAEIATGIKTVKTNAIEGTIYNLNGQKVEKAKKGLFIINGRKVVIK
jgi:hypothetical protein